MGKHWERTGRGLLRVVLSVLLAACFGFRAVRMAGNWESVAEYYGFGAFQGLFWPVISGLLLVAPFLVIGLGAFSLWGSERWGAVLGWTGFGIGLPVFLLEGLTVFARSVNGNGGYVGAEPLLGAVACAVSGAAALLGRKEKK